MLWKQGIYRHGDGIHKKLSLKSSQKGKSSTIIWLLMVSFGMIWVTHMFAHCSRHAQVEAFPCIFRSLPDGRLRINAVKLLVLSHRGNYRPQMHVSFFFNNILSLLKLSTAHHKLNISSLSLALSFWRFWFHSLCTRALAVSQYLRLTSQTSISYI